MGHKVVWSPPCYFDLSPIELLWTDIKGRVAGQYSKQTTFHDVGERLKREFDLCDTNERKESILNMINHSHALLQKINQEMNEEDVHDDNVASSSPTSRTNSAISLGSTTVTESSVSSLNVSE